MTNKKKDEVEIVVKDGVPCIVLDYEVNPEFVSYTTWIEWDDYTSNSTSPHDFMFDIDESDIMNSISKYLKKQGWEEVDDDKK